MIGELSGKGVKSLVDKEESSIFLPGGFSCEVNSFLCISMTKLFGGTIVFSKWIEGVD